MAVIITFLSEFRDRQEPIVNYTTSDPNLTIKGYYTNDSPLIYLLRKLQEELPDENDIRVLAITSYEVVGKKAFTADFEEAKGGVEGCKNLYEYYKNAIEEKNLYGQPFFLSTNGTDVATQKNITIEQIPYGFYFNEKNEVCEQEEMSEEEKACRIYAELVEKLEGEKYIYIDYSGGLRNIQYLMASLIQFFELSHMHCKQIVYSQWRPPKIIDIKNIYDISQIVQAVNDFTETGSVKKLGEIFGDVEQYGYIAKLINSLDSFVKAISVGRVDELDSIRNDIRTNLEQLEISGENDFAQGLYAGIFMLLVPNIKESFHMNDEENSLSYAGIIKWCLEHRFVQQAATIYVEKMPSVYLAHGIDKKAFGLKLDREARGNSEDSLLFFHAFWSRLFPTEAEQFARKLSCAKKNNDDSTLDNIKNLATSDDVTLREKEALSRLTEYLDAYTFSQSSRFGSRELSKNRHQRLRYMLSKDALSKTAYCLLNNCDSAREIEMRFRRDNGSSYKLHKETLEKLCAWAENRKEYQPLYEIMRYYLAVKIIRNHMNHAALMGDKDMEFINALTASECDNMSYDLVVEIISTGLKKSEAETVLTEDMWKKLTECAEI
ncbi:MAG: TM1812 family CRISPR-associated protein [Clostridia bacterium]|nr:TM1812 family CRISPR-associated protein [Clostridia bacterium]